MRVPLRRTLLRALALLLGLFATYSVIAIVVTLALGRADRFRAISVVIASVLVFGVALLAEALARQAWRHATRA